MTLNDENEKPIDRSANVTVTQMGHLVEVQYLAKKNSSCAIRKIDADTYVHLETGELKEFQHNENRGQNLNSLRKTFKRLRYLINNNFTGNPNELFVTFTFKKNSLDNGMVTQDFKNFIKRLKYRYKDETTIDFINVVEPHASGEWHAHMLLRFNELKKIYIPNEELREMWGHGWVTIKSLKDVDNIGAYVSAYLADHPVPDDFEPMNPSTEVIVKQVDGKDKKFIKGGRLQFYPPGMNLYRKSKGILYPEREDMTYKNAQKKVGSAQPHFRKTYEIERDDFKNLMIIEQYNLKRGENDSK